MIETASESDTPSVKHQVDPPPAEEELDEYLVSCRCESARAVSTLLSCLSHVGSSDSSGKSSARDMSQSRRRGSSGAASAIQPVTVFCSKNNLTFHVHHKLSQASVDMQAGLFSVFRVAQPMDPDGQAASQQEEWQAGGEFCVNLTTVLDCLHLLGKHTQSLEKTTLCFTYNLSKEIFKIELLEDSGVLSTAAIPGMLPPEDDLGNSLALAFRSSPIAARIIFKAETLREVVPELELVTGATFGTVSLGPNGLEMAAVGHLGECLISVPSKGTHVVSLEIPEPSKPPVPRTYPLHSLLGSMKGLEIAEETCITMNTEGMMAIQHQVIHNQVGNGSPNFVDFIMCCLEDEDEDEDDRAGDDQASPQNSTRTDSMLGWTQTQESTRHQSTYSQSVSGLTNSTNGGHDDRDTSDDDEHQSVLPFASAAPLFGSLVGDSPSASEAPSRSVRRRTRRPVSSSGRRIVDDDDDSDASRNLMADSDSEEQEDSQPLDVTTSTASLRGRGRNRAADCPSPEVVYKEH